MATSQLFALQRAFAALIPISQLQWPVSEAVDDIQTFLVNDLLLNAHFSHYSPSLSYQRVFWKWVLENLEKNDADIDERLYERYLALSSQASA